MRSSAATPVGAKSFTDAMAEVHGEDRDEDRSRDQHDREERAEHDQDRPQDVPLLCGAVATGAATAVGWSARPRAAAGRAPSARKTGSPRPRKEHDPGDVTGRPKGHPGQEYDTRQTEQPEADQRPGAVAALAEGLRSDRLVVALVGDDEQRCEIDEDAGAADQREDDEADTVERGVDSEVARQAPADTGEHAVVPAAFQPPDRWFFDCVFAHASRVAERSETGNPE